MSMFSNQNWSSPSIFSRNTYIKNMREAKQFTQCINEMADIEYLARSQMELSESIPMSLLPYLEVYSFSANSNPLFECVAHMCAATCLSDAGIAQLVCSCILGATCGNIDIVIDEGWGEAAVIQAVGFANSGNRKSACIDRLLAPFIKFNNEFNYELEKNDNIEKIKFGRGLCKMLNRNIIKNLTIGGSLTTELINDCFAEMQKNIRTINQFVDHDRKDACLIFNCGSILGIGALMKENGGHVSIINSEGDFLIGIDRKAAELLLKGHTGERFSRVVSGRKSIIPHPTLTIANLAQPSIAFEVYANKHLQEVGFLNRLMPYFHQLQHLNFYIANQSSQEVYNKVITTLLSKFYTQDIHNERAVVRMSREAHDVIRYFQSETEFLKIKSEFMSGWLSKLPAQAIRFACAVHCWNCADDPLASCITREEIEIGINIARFSIPAAEFAFSDLGLPAYMDARKIGDWLNSIRDPIVRNQFVCNPIPVSTIGKLTGLRGMRLRSALKYMEGRQWIVMLEKPSGRCWIAFNKKLFV